MAFNNFDKQICACWSLAESGDFDGELFTTHDSRCAARLRPLLERCEALVRAQLYLNRGLRHPSDEAAALFEDLLADLRRELGTKE